MKMPTLSPSEVRTVTIATVAITVSIGYIFGIKPYRAALATARTSLQSETDALNKDRIQVASSKNNPLLIQSVDSAMKAFAPRLFEGTSEVAAAADLATYVAQLAHDNHVFISASATEKPIVSPSGVRTLRVEITADSDLRGILGFLEALDHGNRLVTLNEKLSIEHPATSDNTSDVEVLRVSMIVDGYMVGDPPAPATTGHGAGAPGVPASPAVPATGSGAAATGRGAK